MLGGVSGVFPRPLTLSAMMCLPATRHTVLPEVEAPSRGGALALEEAPLESKVDLSTGHQVKSQVRCPDDGSR